MNDTWRIVFRGETLPGYDQSVVKNNFADLCGISAQEVEKYFSGRLMTLKKGLSQERAQQMIAKLSERGIKAEMEPESLSVANSLYANSSYANSQPQSQYGNPQAEQGYTQNTGSGQYGGAYQSQGSGTSNFNDNYYSSSDTQAEAYNEYSDEIVEPPSFFNFSFDGRYGRLNYINGIVTLSGVGMLVGFVLFMVIGVSFAAVLASDPSNPSGSALGGIGIGSMIIYLLFAIAMGVLGIKYLILRLHDLNLSGWYTLVFFVGFPILMFIPVVNLLALLAQFVCSILLMAWPGTAGPNNYGPPSRKGSIAGLIILLIFVTLYVLMIIMFASIFAAMLGRGF